jgi:nucleoside-diphosphate-sugar epimerase
MRVLITGGTGAVGRAVVERLTHQGWDVCVIGRRPNMELPDAEYQACDITNYNDLREKMRGCQTVVHLAAIPNPRVMPGPELFQINVIGTYNVFEAAAAEGIRHLVQASSINSFGCFWGHVDIRPDYLPIDEEHPTFTTDPYSFSKNVIEDIGAYYWRREGISSVALRLPGVWPRTRLTSEEFRQRLQAVRALIDEFAAQPEAQRMTRLVEIRQATVEYRRQRYMEFPKAQEGIKRDGFSDDLLWPVYAFERFNFWAYVDERDSAQAIEKGLTAEYEGSHVLFINARYNSLDYDSKTLARLFFPEVSQWKNPVNGSESLVSIAKAQALIGFEPEYSI